MEPLDPVQLRVLGSLIEKEFATPDNYPLTLNALTAACNQTSNRDPVMNLDEKEVKRGLDALAVRGFARGVHRGDARVMRYREELREKLHLHQPELAILSVLLLRGPQTVGEIKARTNRLFEFIDLTHVEITLDALATLSTPLVLGLPRQPGQKEARWAHLLGGPPEVEEPGERETSPVAARGVGTSTAADSDTELHRVAGVDRVTNLERQLADLRGEVAELRDQLEAFRRQFE